MSYQVLARKWRPRSFREMVGQTHVLKALINALDSQRLHHAYLFTGTRGVGKTTIARIIAKCLNCETGITSSPCGTCSVCREIDEGRFVDLIEIDAASRTKVEDTRELLDNVQYAPSRGRFKVYLIDEVHMLSSHSFNALLKTLEEPPPYVKFILATTDPQKLPATILSRCLQFSLKNMTPERVVEHLTHVLGVENVPFEDDALWLLGRAADGSMRDAMSLTDQAIAFGEGKVMASDVRAMLGTLDHGQVYDVLHALIEGDAKALLEAVRHLAEQGPDWNGVLSEILNVLHRVAIAQALPEGVDNGHGDRDRVLALAQALPAEDVQFYYQMGLIGRRDLPLAPDPRGGFEMVLLRMLAFRPADSTTAPRQPLKPVGISQATVDSARNVAGPAAAAPVVAAMAAQVKVCAVQNAVTTDAIAPAPGVEPIPAPVVDTVPERVSAVEAA
ncbi:DNA polymerase III subunit gamma/tau, partial [Pseudomonas agarici]